MKSYPLPDDTTKNRTVPILIFGEDFIDEDDRPGLRYFVYPRLTSWRRHFQQSRKGLVDTPYHPLSHYRA